METITIIIIGIYFSLTIILSVDFLKFKKNSEKAQKNLRRELEIQKHTTASLLDGIIELRKAFDEFCEGFEDEEVPASDKSIKTSILNTLLEHSCPPHKVTQTAREVFEFISEEGKKTPEIPTGFALIDVDVLTELYKKNKPENPEKPKEELPHHQV